MDQFQAFVADMNAAAARHRVQLTASEWLTLESCDDPIPWECDAQGHMSPVQPHGPLYDRAYAGHTQAELDERVARAMARVREQGRAWVEGRRGRGQGQ